MTRISPCVTLTAASSTDANNTQRGVNWQLRIDDARTKLISI